MRLRPSLTLRPSLAPRLPSGRLAQRRRARHADRMTLDRTLVVIGAALLVAALTFFVSRKFGFTFLFLPLFFVGGSGKHR